MGGRLLSLRAIASRGFFWGMLSTGLLFSSAYAEETEKPQVDRKRIHVLDRPNLYQSPSVKTPTPKHWFQEPHDWGSGTLTGDWAGFRNTLGDHGVAFGIRYVSISSGNMTGGLDRGFYGGQPIGVTVTVDTESLFNWPGGTVFFDWEFFDWYNNAYPPPAGFDPTGSYVGSNTNVIDRSEKIIYEIAQLYIRQSFFEEAVAIEFGKMDSNLIFSAIDAAGGFQNNISMYTSTLNPFFPTYPNESTAALLQLSPFDFFELSAALFDGTLSSYNPITGTPQRSPFGSSPVTFFENQGFWFVIAQADFRWGLGTDRPGELSVGGWVQTGLTATAGTDKNGVRDVHGFYLDWDQTIWSTGASNASEGGGVRFFGQFGWSDPDKNPVNWSLMSGFSATGILPNRMADAIGVMGAYSKFTGDPAIYQSVFASGAPGAAGGSEASFELFYILQATPFLAIQPGFLWMRTPGGGEPAPLGNATTLYILFTINL